MMATIAHQTVHESRRLRVGNTATVATIPARDAIMGDNMRMANQPATSDEVKQVEPSINRPKK